jgi:superfamily I DNA/RNA helicase
MINNYLYDYGFTFKDLFIKNPPDDKKPSGGSKKTKHIFLAGDDDQAIFTWAGADVKRFIEQPAENQFLEQSVRVPKVVQEISNVILSRIQGPKIKKEYLPSDEEGTQQQIYSLDNVNLLKDKWLILVRTNTILERIEEQLRAKNLYYLTKKGKSYNGRLFRNILNWTRWTKGENLNVTECQDIFEYLDFKFDEKKLGTSISIEDAGFNKNQTWFDAFTKTSNEEKLYIRAMLSNGEKLSQDARIELSTIHVAKGGEEQNVIVVLDNARKIRQAIEHNTDKQEGDTRRKTKTRTVSIDEFKVKITADRHISIKLINHVVTILYD